MRAGKMFKLKNSLLFPIFIRKTYRKNISLLIERWKIIKTWNWSCTTYFLHTFRLESDIWRLMKRNRFILWWKKNMTFFPRGDWSQYLEQTTDSIITTPSCQGTVLRSMAQAAPLGKACRGSASHLLPLSQPGRKTILGSMCCLMWYDFCIGPCL